MTEIIKCICKNEYQDEKYGIGNRVANEKKAGGLTCSVCHKVHGGTGKTKYQSEKKK